MGQGETNNNQKNKNNEQKGRGLFYAVIAVATFIIMAVGATFAYFTATTNSMDQSVRTGSTTLQLQYISYESAWMRNDLIPADTEVVEYSFEYQDDAKGNSEKEANYLCKDDDGNSICSVYVFQVKNSANSAQTVSVKLQGQNNEFANLNAMIYEISIDNIEDYNNGAKSESNTTSTDPTFKQNEIDTTEGAIEVKDGVGTVLTSANYTPIYVNRKGVGKTLLKYNEEQTTEETDETIIVKKPSIDRAIRGTEQVKLADDITIEGGSYKTFAIVLYIKNLETDQTIVDAAKAFSGKVLVSPGDGGEGVSGTINAAINRDENNETLQSGQ